MKKAILSLLLAGCGGLHYEVPYLARSVPAARRLGPVSGDDCTATVFGAHARDVRLERALERALDGTEATGMVDVEIVSEGRLFETCLVVRGTAVR